MQLAREHLQRGCFGHDVRPTGYCRAPLVRTHTQAVREQACSCVAKNGMGAGGNAGQAAFPLKVCSRPGASMQWVVRVCAVDVALETLRRWRKRLYSRTALTLGSHEVRNADGAEYVAVVYSCVRLPQRRQKALHLPPAAQNPETQSGALLGSLTSAMHGLNRSLRMETPLVVL